MDELKPCPFCGGEPVFVENGKPLDLYRIVCTVCGANVTSLKYPVGKNVAIVKWNRRKVGGDG